MARGLSSRLGYRHIDTGAMYRAVAWKALQQGLALDDEDAVARIAEDASLDVTDGVIRIDGQDVTNAIRTPAIDHAAAMAARLPTVRQALVARQRETAKHRGVVMEGRDVGTVVFRMRT